MTLAGVKNVSHCIEDPEICHTMAPHEAYIPHTIKSRRLRSGECSCWSDLHNGAPPTSIHVLGQGNLHNFGELEQHMHHEKTVSLYAMGIKATEEVIHDFGEGVAEVHHDTVLP